MKKTCDTCGTKLTRVSGFGVAAYYILSEVRSPI